VAVDRSIEAAERFNLPGPLPAWRLLRRHIHETVCAEGIEVARSGFVQSFGETALDASLLQIPLVGFLPADDPTADGLPPGEGAFLACSCWLVEVYVMQGWLDEAGALFARLAALIAAAARLGFPASVAG